MTFEPTVRAGMRVCTQGEKIIEIAPCVHTRWFNAVIEPLA